MNFLLAVLGLLSCFAISPVNVTVNANSCYLYQEPSFESEKVYVDEEAFVLNHGDTLTIIEEKDNFALVQTIDNTIGYVYKFYLAYPDDYQIYPTFNASVRNNNSIIYNLEKEKTTYTANAGDKIFLFEGYDADSEFTAIQIVLENGSLYNGYMLTKDVSPNGISASLIVGITIICAVATIILSLLFIKKKKTGSKH